MKHLILLTIILSTFWAKTASAQIDAADSSVQAITYWDKGEKHDYWIIQERIILGKENTDTTLHETATYNIEVSVLDSTQNEYTIQWRYKDYESDGDDFSVLKIFTQAGPGKLIYKTDETGVFKEVVNEEEIINNFRHELANVSGQLKLTDGVKPFEARIKELYASPNILIKYLINPVLQFHGFYGMKYKLGDTLSTQHLSENPIGGDPIKTIVSAYLEYIDDDNESYVLRSSSIIDGKQFGEAMAGYMKAIGVGKRRSKKLKEKYLFNVENETQIRTLFHDSGWVLHSDKFGHVKTELNENFDYITIEMQEIEDE